MLKIEFNDQKFAVPNSWADVRLCDYEKWFMQTPTDKMEYVRFVADVCKIDSDFLLNSPTQLFDVLANAIQFLNNPEFEPAHKVNIEGKEFFVSTSDQFTLGEWIDIEETLSSDSQTKVSELLAIVCRPVQEDYSVETAALRKEVFRNLSCEKTLPLVAFFFAQKERTRTDFEPLFSGDSSGRPVSKGYKDFCNKWGWYKTIADLAEDKIYLFDQITRKTVVEVFRISPLSHRQGACRREPI